MEREIHYENNINIGLHHIHRDLMEKLNLLYSDYLNEYEYNGVVCEIIFDLFEDIDYTIGDFFADTNFKNKIKNTVERVYLDGKIDGVKNYAKKEGE